MQPVLISRAMPAIGATDDAGSCISPVLYRGPMGGSRTFPQPVAVEPATGALVLLALEHALLEWYPQSSKGRLPALLVGPASLDSAPLLPVARLR